ncbi:MAG TPA: hypothetical protein VIH21_05035, partial [Dehalococcoidia bacterium]
SRAFVQRDFPTFASYMTPQALTQMHGQTSASHPDRYSILDVVEDGFTGVSRVRFRAPSFVLRQRWERAGDSWRAVIAERLPEPTRPLWQRVARMSRASVLPADERNET